MHVVAIQSLPKEKEGLAKLLAAKLGITVYEARSRLITSGDGPCVAAVLGSLEQAEQKAAVLRSGGFDVLVLAEDDVESDTRRFLVRKFELNDQDLCAESRAGACLKIAYHDFDLILCGVSSILYTETRTVRDRKFSMGRAILSSGLMMTKSEVHKGKSTTEERERFFHLYAGERPALVFREGALLYDSLGPAMRPSRSSNFTHLLTELRRRSPKAVYDDRLLHRGMKTGILGPSLSPQKHLDIAITLLRKTLR